MAQTATILLKSDDPNDCRPPVTVNGRLAEIFYRLLLAAEDITKQPSVNISIQCWNKNVVVEVVKKY